METSTGPEPTVRDMGDLVAAALAVERRAANRTDRIRAVNQRWLATMGMDDETLRMKALELRAGDAAELPAARLGRCSRGAGGVLLALWRWLRTPRVETFRVCSRCGLTRDEDRRRCRRVAMRTCTGWMGEPYNRCMSAQYRLG